MQIGSQLFLLTGSIQKSIRHPAHLSTNLKRRAEYQDRRRGQIGWSIHSGSTKSNHWGCHGSDHQGHDLIKRIRKVDVLSSTIGRELGKEKWVIEIRRPILNHMTSGNRWTSRRFAGLPVVSENEYGIVHNNQTIVLAVKGMRVSNSACCESE